MKIVLATGNMGKLNEFKKLMPDNEIIAYKDIIGDYEVVEDKDSFKGNAIKKATEIYEKINDNDVIVISDDSGITVPILNNEPGIYSARYAGENANDENNNLKLISKLNERNLKTASAYYTACIAIVYKNETYSVHGWMHGEVINEQKGNKGFGYDPLFIPKNFSNTLGELDDEIKKEISHRSKALNLAKKVLEVIL